MKAYSILNNPGSEIFNIPVFRRNPFNSKFSDKNPESKFSAVDRIFNLGSENRFSLLQSIGDKDELESTLQTISKMIKKGIVGYEYLDINNKPYKSFITTSIGDQRLAGAKPYREKMISAYL